MIHLVFYLSFTLTNYTWTLCYYQMEKASTSLFLTYFNLAFWGSLIAVFYICNLHIWLTIALTTSLYIKGSPYIYYEYYQSYLLLFLHWNITSIPRDWKQTCLLAFHLIVYFVLKSSIYINAFTIIHFLEVWPYLYYEQVSMQRHFILFWKFIHQPMKCSTGVLTVIERCY